jgi:hypothetical protein
VSRLVQLLGLVGAACFMVSGIPMAVKTLAAGRVEFVPRSTSVTVLMGALLIFSFLTASFGLNWVVAVDYLPTICSWAVVVWYDLFPRRPSPSFSVCECGRVVSAPLLGAKKVAHDLVFHAFRPVQSVDWEAVALKLATAIKEHRDQRADDRCWMDDAGLYSSLAGTPFWDGRVQDIRVGDRAAMLRNCERFLERRCAGGAWLTYAELEAKVVELKAELEAYKRL